MTDPHPAEADHTGQALGASYRLLDRIGSGAVGEVWRVESITDGSVLAAKILKPEHASDTALVERFVRERSLLVGLRHPNIVTVRDMVVDYALRDNTNAWELGADGSYVRLSPEGGQEFSSQTALCDMPATRLLVEPPRKRGK